MKYKIKNISEVDITIDGFILGNEEVPLLTIDILGDSLKMSKLNSYIVKGDLVVTESSKELDKTESEKIFHDLYILSVEKGVPVKSKISQSFNAMYGEDLIEEMPNLTDKQKTIAAYRYHTQNGVKFYEDFRADLAIDIAQGISSPESSFRIEAKLSDIKGMLLAGDWRTAQFACTQLVSDEFLTQELIDQVQIGFDNYVSENF